jgi:hypothetical protein
VLISSPAFGPKAQILVTSLALIDIPAHVLTSQDELLFELVLKNLYIRLVLCFVLIFVHQKFAQ